MRHFRIFWILSFIIRTIILGKEGQIEVNKSIKHLLVSLSAVQLKWLIRIILKDLKIGIKETIIFDSFHPDAIDLYNFTSSLEKVCNTLIDPSKRLHEVGVSIFTPCRPMLGNFINQTFRININKDEIKIITQVKRQNRIK